MPSTQSAYEKQTQLDRIEEIVRQLQRQASVHKLELERLRHLVERIAGK
jgi:hypothetical protein